MKTIERAAEAVWQKTPFAKLVRFVPSGKYFARLRIRGKLIRRSLQTQSMTVAKLRLADLEKEERQRSEVQEAGGNGNLRFGDALAIFRSRLKSDASLKPRTKEFREERITALLKSWPVLEQTDVRKIGKQDCLNWATGYAAKIATPFLRTGPIPLGFRLHGAAFEGFVVSFVLGAFGVRGCFP